jgi:tRNA G18 (ribose-2'-O)-methylase SpoU
VKFNAKYSKEKFQNFSFDAQLKAMRKLLKELEINIADGNYRQNLLAQIRYLFPFFREAPPQKMQDLLVALPDDPHRLLRALASYHTNATLKDNQINIRVGDGSASVDFQKKLEADQICIVADNLRSVFNVGSLFRLCECLSIGELMLCGISPDPHHPNMNKTALGTCERVKWSKWDQTEDAITELKKRAYRIYALETAEPSSSVFANTYQLPLALVVGNEALGIDPQLIKLCDEIVHLPVLGWKNSLNVSVATSIAVYHILFGADHGNP